MKYPLLVVIELASEQLLRFELAGFQLYFAQKAAAGGAVSCPDCSAARAVLTNGSEGFSAQEMDALPHLEIICALGAGYENIDLAAATARGIALTHGPGTNDVSVADHTLALMLSVARGIAPADAAVRRGAWAQSRRQPRPTVSGKKLGIFGLGRIGLQIAQRAAGGFGMPVGYHNRRPNDTVSHTYFSTLAGLAQWADFLVIAAPGGAATRHAIDAAVLDALGPDGFLINIARGSVVDTVALIAALEQGRIAGAALDVIEGEPAVPSALVVLDNILLTPHSAGRSPEAVAATTQLVLDNLTAHFAGRPLPTPVPLAGPAAE